MRAGSTSPTTMPGPSSRSATIRPHGSISTRMAVGAAAAGVRAALRSGEHVALVLDRACAQQQVPVRRTRRRRERRRHEDQREIAQTAIELGKAQVVAHRECRRVRTAARWRPASCRARSCGPRRSAPRRARTRRDGSCRSARRACRRGRTRGMRCAREPGPRHAMGTVPPTSQMRWRRASACEKRLLRARRRPLRARRPCRSRARRRCRSTRAARRAARRAAAASATSGAAASRFAATSSPDTICTAATRNGSARRRDVSAGSRAARRHRVNPSSGVCGTRSPSRCPARDHRIGPAARHRVLVAEQLLERILEHALREQRARAHGGADERIREEQQRGARRHAARQRRLHVHRQALGLLREVGVAGDLDLGRGADQAQVVRRHHAVRRCARRR